MLAQYIHLIFIKYSLSSFQKRKEAKFKPLTFIEFNNIYIYRFINILKVQKYKCKKTNSTLRIFLD